MSPPAAGAARAGSVLDEAFARMASAGFELPNGFVNHGAMACEALDALGFGAEVDEWAKRFARIAGPGVSPQYEARFEWREALGQYRLLPQWVGHFERAIAEEGWARVVQVWAPRLMPGMSTALFHGAIRTGHAVRAVAASATTARQEELALALGYWAARFRPGQGAPAGEEVVDVRHAAVGAAAGAARYYLASPSIYFLHGVTGAMALELLLPHIAGPDQANALAQLAAEHAGMYSGARAVPADVRVTGALRGHLVNAAQQSGDPHEVKLVEAALRALDLTGDPVFAAACETVTGLAADGAA